jgi:hypothetical protein
MWLEGADQRVQPAQCLAGGADAGGPGAGKSGARSLANAVVVARTVLEDVDMDVVGMRLAGARAEHGREPVATPPCEPHRLQRGHSPGLMMSLAPFVSSKIRISAAIPSAWALPAFGRRAFTARPENGRPCARSRAWLRSTARSSRHRVSSSSKISGLRSRGNLADDLDLNPPWRSGSSYRSAATVDARRVLLPADCTLRELHSVFQVAMGGVHLYQFRLRAARYGSGELSAPAPAGRCGPGVREVISGRTFERPDLQALFDYAREGDALCVVVSLVSADPCASCRKP